MNLFAELPLIYSHYPQDENSPHNVVIEIPATSSLKYEYDRSNQSLRLTKILRYPLPISFSYGFLPRTFADDDDALDVVLLTGGHIVQPLSIVPSYIIGVLMMKDKGKCDHKILASPAMFPMTSYPEIGKHILAPYESFIKGNKSYEGTKFEIFGWKGKKEAMKIIAESRESFRKGHF